MILVIKYIFVAKYLHVAIDKTIRIYYLCTRKYNITVVGDVESPIFVMLT